MQKFRFVTVMALVLAAQGAGQGAAQDLNLSLTDPDDIAAVCGGDMAAGETIFAAHCAACHAVREDDGGGFGPHLHAVFGRVVATGPVFDYSPALQMRGADGTYWERDTLVAYLGAPDDFAPGAAPHPVIRDTVQLQNLLTHLRVVSHPPPPARGSVVVPAEVLSMAGDAEYGAYLASECAACHQAGGQGIPAIYGLSREVFLTAMYEFRLGARDNSAMRNVAGRLGDEELVSLAEYFAQSR
jgi:cytochrome c